VTGRPKATHDHPVHAFVGEDVHADRRGAG
jgi:hypothetical protein